MTAFARPSLPRATEVRDTGTPRGRGVFATAPYAAGDIVEIAPVLLLNMAFEELPTELRTYVYDWPEIGGRDAPFAMGLGYASLYNSANPSNMVYRASACNTALVITACRDIKPGEELTINYDAEAGENTADDPDWFDRMGIQQF